MPVEKTYLGDSVYAAFDGWGVTLTTENGLPGDPSNTIVLEPEVVTAFLTFVEQLKRSMDMRRGRCTLCKAVVYYYPDTEACPECLCKTQFEIMG